MKRYGELTSLLALALCSVGCAFGPFQDDTIPSTTSVVAFSLYSITSGATVTAECATHYSGFSQFASKVASTSPVDLNGDNLYPATINKVIPASCWDFGFGKPVTWLQFFQKKDGKSYRLFVFDDAGASCVGNELGDGTGAIVAGQECGEAGQLRLFANY
jgi:hypothetical protein